VALLRGGLAVRVAAEAEVSVEEAIRDDPEWRRGVECGASGPGHPEDRVIEHIEEVLGNVDQFATDDEQRERLRVIALVHDAFKADVRWWTGDHARLAHKFVRRFTDDEGIRIVVRDHDDSYRAWRFGKRTRLWFVARWRARRLISRLGPHLDLFRVFYRCDNETGDKSPDDRLWFEELLSR
jgi:hypothetical protein